MRDMRVRMLIHVICEGAVFTIGNVFGRKLGVCLRLGPCYVYYDHVNNSDATLDSGIFVDVPNLLVYRSSVHASPKLRKQGQAIIMADKNHLCTREFRLIKSSKCLG